MTRSCLLTGAALLLIPAIAAAEARPIQPVGEARYFDILATKPNASDLQFGRQLLPPTGTSGIAASRTIYLNRTGVTLSPGNNDSRTNRSTIASQQTTIPAWNTDAATWNATVACVRDLFSPFGVTVVETDPGAVPHIEAVFGGSPTQLGLPTNVAGVSPFTQDCSVIENSIVFTFTNVIPNDARLACEIQAQEIAHSFGLDHELLASDPMTYLEYNANRSFKNQAASCGEDVTRPCGINGSTCRANQNSVALLTERLGAAGNPGDTTSPTLGITSPQDGATVPPGFDIQFTATDNINIAMATLFIDDQAAGSLLMAPFKFTTSATLPEGEHSFRIEVTDGTNVKTQSMTLTIRKGAAPPSGGGDNDLNGDLTGGCSTGGNAGGFGLALGLLGLVLRRRRR
ncbi:MAG: Ig-like domain-containing protein [Deltaproteobacteria bacterium]|nr:Ig-like domain-containing protein [Deltaproteobacteria bacterium]